MPFMDEPPGSKLSTEITGHFYGPMIKSLRAITNHTHGQGTEVAAQRQRLTTGYKPTWS